MPYVTVGIVITPSKYYVDDGVPAIRSLNVKDGRLIDEDLVFFSEEDNRKLAKTRIYKDDVVIVRTGQTGSCAVVDERFHGANCIDLIIVRKSRHLRSRFLHYFLASGEAAAEITMSSNGAIQQHFNIGLVREIGLLQPSSEEQDAILTFLDRETAKIDRLMAVRQKQVERLQEQRTAVIHHAVTKGLDPQAKMKPSGVEWLGEVPEGWATYRLRHLLRPGKDGIRIGPFGSSLRAEFIRDEGYKVYGQENVIGRSFQLGARHVDTSKFNELSDYALRPGDVLITMMGSIGRCIVVPEDIQIGIMDSHLIRVGVDERKVRPRYLALLIEEAPYVAACIQNESKGSIMDGLNSGIIKRLTILLPTIEEQQLIMEHLARETAKIDTLIAKYQRELELLAEYRASLISHAVTGKIDVRGLVEPIPSEAP
jgi:type I restriction enzyme S subunit